MIIQGQKNKEMIYSNLKSRKRHVFMSVFEVSDGILSTEIGKFNTSTDKSDSKDISIAEEQELNQKQWNASWILVTQKLSLPRVFNCETFLRPRRDQLDSNFYYALRSLLFPSDMLKPIKNGEDIINWLSSEVRKHYLNQVFPTILQQKRNIDPELELIQIFDILKIAYRQYEYKLSFIKEQLDEKTPGASQSVDSKFHRDLIAVIRNTIMNVISAPLKLDLKSYVTSILKLQSEFEYSDSSAQKKGFEADEADRALLNLVNTLKTLDLAGEDFQVIFAEIMNQVMSEFINRGFQGPFSSNSATTCSLHMNGIRPLKGKFKYQKGTLNQSECVCILCEWIENEFARVVFQVLNLIDERMDVSWTEKERFKEIGIGRLAELRTRQLFDIVQNWPQNDDLLDDLRTAITTPERRLHLTEVFARTLTNRVLHPAASTTYILKTYVSMIWSFHSLDQSKVLLDKVAYPLQLYLCTREDTVKIIITSLLLDTDEAAHSCDLEESLNELSWLLNNKSELRDQRVLHEDLNWHDLDWLPDPVDAGPGYKRSKNVDVIGTLFVALGSKEVFIKEFQKIIGENFLKNIEDFHREIKVMELLKIQFGEAPLQACEVMLKDIQDSKKIDGIIQKFLCLNSSERSTQQMIKGNQKMFESRPEGLKEPSLHTKVLSRLYWPQLHAATYRVPSKIYELQKRYEEGFESLKSSRKLTWLDRLGQCTVKLEFEDREIIEEVHTWQATVIWTFQNDGLKNKHQKWTVQELIENLEMEEVLVRNALKFWIKKFVLYEPMTDTYAVREKLTFEERDCLNNQIDVSRSANGSDQNNDVDQKKVQIGIRNENMEMYWQFIHGMLTNSSSQMTLQQISAMLKMLIIDGFPHSNTELKEFLDQKMADESLEMIGGKYRLKK